MRSLFCSTLLVSIMLGGCSTGNRGISSPHQPLVTAAGVAVVPGCPDWHDKNLPPTDAQSSNYGCATAVNLAAMVADPNDLVRGKSVKGSDAEIATRAVRAWRETPPSSKQWQVTTQVSSKSTN